MCLFIADYLVILSEMLDLEKKRKVEPNSLVVFHILELR